MKWNYFKIHYLVRLSVFWLLFFALFRVLFIIYHHAKIPDGEHSETSLSFIYGLRLDLATISALIFIPYLLWSFQQFYKNRFIHLLNLGYNISLIVIVSVLSIFNIKIYGEYGTMMNTEDLVYLLYPKEAVTFLSIWSLLLLLGTSAFIAFLGIKAYRRNITNFSLPVENKIIKTIQIAIIPFLLFIAFRGGFQNVPINEDESHYSNLNINNDIATNNIWYLGHSIVYRNGTVPKNEN
jgi:hypothetical protein